MRRNIHISLIIIMLSFALFSSYHIYYYFLNKNKEELIEEYKEIPIINNETMVNKISNNIKKEEYIGIIEIPKIGLKEGFYNKNSSNNNVNKSVTILPESNDSIIYLAAHSGVGHLAYFKDLNKLSINDKINLTYHNINHTYLVTDIYEYPKIGHITINRNINLKYLILTTCSYNKDMQLVVVAKLINVI